MRPLYLDVFSWPGDGSDGAMSASSLRRPLLFEKTVNSIGRLAFVVACFCSLMFKPKGK